MLRFDLLYAKQRRRAEVIIFSYLNKRYLFTKFVGRFVRFHKRSTVPLLKLTCAVVLIQKKYRLYILNKGSYINVLRQIWDKYHSYVQKYIVRKEKKNTKMKLIVHKMKAGLSSLMGSFQDSEKQQKLDKELRDTILEEFQQQANRQYAHEWSLNQKVKKHLQPFVTPINPLLTPQLKRVLKIQQERQMTDLFRDNILHILPKNINIRKFLRAEKKERKARSW